MEKKRVKISISRLLIMSNCVIMAVFFGITFYFTTNSYQKVLEQEFRANQHQMLAYISDAIGETMDSIELLARSTANSYTIIHSITNYQKQKNSYNQLVFQNNMNQNLSAVAYSLNDIVSANILMDDPQLRTTKVNGAYDYGGYAEGSWAEEIRKMPSGWISARENDLLVPSYTEKIITYVQRIYSDLYYGEPLGHLVINLDEEMFYEVIHSYVDTGGATILVAGEDGSIFSSTDRNVVGMRLAETKYGRYRKILEEGRGQSEKMEGMLVTETAVDGKGLFIMAVTDYRNALAPIAGTRKAVSVFSLAMLGFFSVFSGLLAYVIAKPILLLSREVKKYKGNGWNHKIRQDSHIYEIDILGEAFNHMADKIEALISSLLEQEKEKQKQELEILQAQINPHFLYNTLEAINWMALSMKQKEISRMVILLGTFLRLSLNKGKNVYTVKDELHHLQCYLDIQNIRCRGKIEFYSEIDPDMMECRMIKLLLQPLVENSILHGFDRNGGAGRIWLKAERKEGFLFFSVRDDGCGMEAAQIGRICDLHTEEGHGLKNVIKRIALYYGDGCGLTIHSLPGEGTTVEIKIADAPSGQISKEE